MSKVQTDNSNLSGKIQLRIESLPDKQNIKVLECFSGDSKMWNSVIKKTDKKIQILRIDQKPDKNSIYLKGDNIKFLGLMSLDNYDIIDLDAYGIPFKQLEIIFKKDYRGIVHVTCIQSIFGRINNNLLINLGYTKKMINKIPTIFMKNGALKLKKWLAKNGISKIRHITKNRKNYLWFSMQDRQIKGGQNVTYL